MNANPLNSRKPQRVNEGIDAPPDEGFHEPPISYAPWFFWFWNGPLSTQRITDMAAEMCRQRINPGYVHARFHPHYPIDFWLSDKWFEAFRAALETTAQAGMYMTYTTGDPMMPHRMIVEKEPELKAESLGWVTVDVPGGTTFPVPESFFSVAAKRDDTEGQNRIIADSLKIVGDGPAFSWRAPEQGSWRLYIFNKYLACSPAGAPVNFLDRRFASAWIDVEHRKYDDRYREFMGSTMPSIFIDHEGSYGYKIAWSDDLAKDYRSKTGRDIRLWMPLLIEEDVEGLWGKARWDWFDTVSNLYSECLIAPVRKWCHERGMNVTCHFWEENLYAQAMQVGSIFTAQRAYSIPGTDSLFLEVLKPREFKETQSVCEFEGRQFMSEILGVAGWHLSPAMMKKAVNCSIAWGLTHIMLHAVNSHEDLSLVSYPTDFFTENPYWRYLHLYSDFSRRAAYVNDHGRIMADVLLLHPIDSVWALLGDGIFDPVKPHDTYLVQQKNILDARHGAELEQIEKVYSRAMDDLTRARVEFLIADEVYFREMTVSNGGLSRGKFVFKTVVLPSLRMISLGLAEKLVTFASTGGQVYALGRLPDGSIENGMDDPLLKSQMNALQSTSGFIQAADGLMPHIAAHARGLVRSAEFEAGEFPLLSSQRLINGRSFIWLANNEAERQECVLLIRNASGEASIWNCETGSRSVVASEDVPGGSRVKLTINPYEAFWLVHDPNRPAVLPTEGRAPSAREQVLAGPWTVSIDEADQPPRAQLSLPAPTWLLHGGETRPLESWLKWDLRQFTGFVDYSCSFQVEEPDHLILDLGQVRHTAEVWVNGQSVGARLWAPFRFQVDPFLRHGENTIRLRIGNLIFNAITQYETYPWPWYGKPNDEALDAGLLGPVKLVKP